MGQYIDFAYVKQHADFSAILTHYNLDLDGSGDERRCCCPFHEDERPSMTVNLEKGVFQCHAASCGMKGNVLDFVAGLENEGLRSAALSVSTICKIRPAPPVRTNGKAKPAKKAAKTPARPRPKQEEKEPVADEVNGVNTPLTFSLKLDPEHPYGASRSLSPSVIEQFEMGYCNKGMMVGRWCMPIHNVDAEVVAYIGRYADEPVPKDKPKYLLPKDFNKQIELFNLHRVAGHSEVVVLVEGIFDVARLHSLAMPAVGLFGSSISDEQLSLLSVHGFREAVVLLDSGAMKAERKLVHRVSREMFVRSVALPDGEDPATVSEALLREQVPLFEL